MLAMALAGCAHLWPFGPPSWGPEAVPEEARDALRLSTVGVRGTMLRLMGGPQHATYLGCLSCEPSHPESILNPDGAYGKLDGEKGIWSPKSPYGGKNGPYSPWNATPARPPLVVTEYGHKYGVLTVAPDWPGRTIEPGLLRFVAVMGVHAP